MPIGPILIILAFFLFLIGIIVWAIRYGRRKNKEKNQRYRDFALRLNLVYNEKPHLFVKLPVLTGTFRNHSIKLYEKVIGSGKNQTFYTIIEFPGSSHNFQFRIGKEHFFSKIGKKIGFKDIEFDQFELDKKFLFKSKDEAQFRALMNYKILHELEAITEHLKGSIEHADGVLSYTQVGVLSKPEHFEGLEKVLHFMEQLMRK